MTRLLLVAAVLLTACAPAKPSATLVRATAVPAPTSAPTATPALTPVPTRAPTAPPPTPVPCTNCFDAARAMADVRTLSVDIGIRRAGEGGDRRAAQFIESRLDGLGYDASLDTFTIPNGKQTDNVVTAVPPQGRWILVAAHYDTVAVSPGANDNGTGTASALELARLLRIEPASITVAVALFSAEEVQQSSADAATPKPVGGKGPHHLGSVRYLNGLNSEQRSRLVTVLNLDEVGFGTQLYCTRMDTGPREATQRLVTLAKQLNIPARERVTPDWSDNGTFLKAGINAGWLWSGTDPLYHTPRDTIDHVQPESVARAGALGLAFVRSYS